MIRIVSNAAAFLARMDRARKSHIPFAVAVALTRTASDAKAATERRIADKFDRPTPFTRRGVFVSAARKKTWRATVGIKRIQAEYLGLQERGGVRTPTNGKLLMPVGVRLNQYGNIARGRVGRLLTKPDTFSGTVRGVAGVWQRRRGGLKLLVAYERRARYAPRFGFERGAEAAARSKFPDHFRRTMAEFRG
jgi:hypothetical protein